MGRPPCCDKMGIKKGPWTPEEDIILVSFIQEHGPGNWKAVPTNTGLRRCSKSCRLRWTNYLRPGIKRGNFTDHEEKMIIHLQALMGNRWAAIASYLPQRTDNDIKNYWNTHLKKKLKRLQTGDHHHHHHHVGGHDTTNGLLNSQPMSKGQWEKRLQTDINMARKALTEALSPEKPDHDMFCQTKPNICPTYVLSTENVSRLLEKWMENSPPQKKNQKVAITDYSSSSGEGTDQSSTNEENMSVDALESLLGFDSSRADVSKQQSMTPPNEESGDNGRLDLCLFRSAENKGDFETEAPLSLLEKWLLDEVVAEEERGVMEVQVNDTNGML